MGFRVGSHAQIWGITQKETRTGELTTLNITINKRNKDGNYVKDFSGFATLWGKAAEKANSIAERDVIKLLEVDVSTNYVKASGKNYTNFNIYDFEVFKKAENDTPEPSVFDDIEDISFGGEVPF